MGPRVSRSLDDPVRMYMRQMGKVPLLTREQEVEICKRIEQAEAEARRIVYGFGFAAKEHLAMAEKLLAEPPKERFDRVIVDKLVSSRNRHLKTLRRLIKKVRRLDEQADARFTQWQKAGQQGPAQAAPGAVPAAGPQAAGHVSQVLLPAAGGRRNGARGGERSREG